MVKGGSESEGLLTGAPSSGGYDLKKDLVGIKELIVSQVCAQVYCW
jgi:hypothetical protein